MQQRYDRAFLQCMYAKGHRVPVSGRYSDSAESTQSAARTPPPPPPPGQPPRGSSARLSPEVDNAGMLELAQLRRRRWVAGTGAPKALLNPTTEEPLAHASSEGVDLKAALALRALRPAGRRCAR